MRFAYMLLNSQQYSMLVAGPVLTYPQAGTRLTPFASIPARPVLPSWCLDNRYIGDGGDLFGGAKDDGHVCEVCCL